MTIKYPKENVLDKVLKQFGKERRVILPENYEEQNQEYGSYSTIIAKKENFWKALFRNKDDLKH